MARVSVALPAAGVLWGAGWQGHLPLPHTELAAQPVQPSPATTYRKHVPLRATATGQSTGDIPRGREWREGGSSTQAGALWPATQLC